MTDYLKFDSRIVERKIKSGEITQKELDTYIKSLEDCSDFSELDEEQLMKDANIKKREQ